MALCFDSPRFNLRDAPLADIEQSINDVGHVVLDGLWNRQFLGRLHDFAVTNFATSSKRATHFDGVLPPDHDREFFTEFERSGLPALLRHLLSGDFVVSQTERVVRRADATVPAQFSGLHMDGQLRYCSDRGIHSKREFTIWTALQDCARDDTPRLLLLHRGDTFADVFSSQEAVADEGNSYLPIELRPQMEAAGLERAADRLDQMFDRLYEAKRCYAPPIPFGSAVLFEHNIVHGSYRRRNMVTPRYSLDFRVVGVYRPARANARYQGVAFRSSGVPQGLYATALRAYANTTLAVGLLGGALRGDLSSVRRVKRQLNKLRTKNPYVPDADSAADHSG
jgi:hypothetical protein